MSGHVKTVQVAMEACCIFSVASSLLIFVLIVSRTIKIPEDKEPHRCCLLVVLVYDIAINVLGFFGALNQNFGMCVAFGALKLFSLWYIAFVVGVVTAFVAAAGVLLAFVFAGVIANNPQKS